MYLAVRSWGIAPQDFYGMTLGQILAEADMRRPRDPSRDLAGSLTRSEERRVGKECCR